MTTVVNRPSRPHRPHRGFTDEWMTPPWILARIGTFDLDPCCPEVRPWDTAAVHWTKRDDGLAREFFGRVWMNPPYGPLAERFMAKMAAHGCGVALVFARTETEWFHATVWSKASAVLFFKGRLHFHDVSGREAKGNAGGPSVLVAYGNDDAELLASAEFDGRYIRLADGGRDDERRR